MRLPAKLAAVVCFLVAPLMFGDLGCIPANAHPPRVKSPIQSVPVDNVKDFGAKGDGVTDDQNAIQSAIADAQTNLKVLFFPPGTYLHSDVILFNGVVVAGSGASSVLYATNNTNSAVVLAGTNVSIQNMVISTAGLTGGSNLLEGSTFAVADGTSFTVKNNTIVQGVNRIGIFIAASSIGSVSAVTCDGTGSGNSNEIGVFVGQSNRVSLVGNLFQNETVGVGIAQSSQSIAVLSNTIGNVSFPTSNFGIEAVGITTLDIAQNTIQMSNSTSSGSPIFINGGDVFSISQNNVYGGQAGIAIAGAGSSNNSVSQNAIHNCGIQGIETDNIASTALAITSNQFGECGLFASGSSTGNAVILVEGSAASGATTLIQNNSYQGHLNGLTSYVTSALTAPQIPAANVTGNTQSQTALSNHI